MLMEEEAAAAEAVVVPGKMKEAAAVAVVSSEATIIITVGATIATMRPTISSKIMLVLEVSIKTLTSSEAAGG